MENNRIYVCHTFYHVYITFLKEFKLRSERKEAGIPIGDASVMLSKLSIDFGSLRERLEALGFFKDVIEFDEKRDDFFPELKKWRDGRGNLVGNLIYRMIFTSKYAKAEEKYMPVDMKQYDGIYVFCDSDPIGYYLNKHRIKYHAIEDGLNVLRNFDAARYDNRGHFKLKAFMSERLNLIFVQNGYGKYCIDMEVNDKSLIQYQYRKYKSESRTALADRLTSDEKELLLKAFVTDWDELRLKVNEANQKGNAILILTDPICALDVRERIFRDIVDEYKVQGSIFIKPHPRDILDYRKLFPEYPIIEPGMPMEIFNYFPGLHFRTAVTVLTEMKAIKFADNIVRKGEDFMDIYEDPAVHRQNESIGIGRPRPDDKE